MVFNYNFIAQWCLLLADLEARLILDQLSVLANIGKAISINWNISKLSYRCITTVTFDQLLQL